MLNLDQLKWEAKICNGGFGFWHNFSFALSYTRAKWVTSPDHLCGPLFLPHPVHPFSFTFLTFQCLKLRSICICLFLGLPVPARLNVLGVQFGATKVGTSCVHFPFGTEWESYPIQQFNHILTLIKAGPQCIRHALWYRMLPQSGVFFFSSSSSFFFFFLCVSILALSTQFCGSL